MKNIYNLNSEKVENFITYLFLFLPIALILGRGISDVIISVIALYFLIISIFFKKYNYYKNFYSIIFFLFVLYGIIRSLLSDFPIFSLLENGSVFYFRYFFFSLGVCYLIDIKTNLMNKFCRVFFLCLIILSFDALFQFIFGFNILGMLPPEQKNSKLF